MNRLALSRLLVELALRNLRTHRGKTLIVASIMFFGTMLWTVGSSLVDSVEAAMQRTVVESLTGHLQIYATDTRDELSLFGGGTMGAPDIGEIADVAAVRAAVADVARVEAVVPMGSTVALMANESDLDQALVALREAVRANDTTAVAVGVPRVQRLVAHIRDEVQSRVTGATRTPEVERSLVRLDYALAATFWTAFADDPLTALEFLDTRVAPLGADGTLIYMRLLGTDLQQYPQVFDQFELVAGEMVPPGTRGVLFSTFYYEQIKHMVAREFDKIREAVVDDGKAIGAEPALRERVQRMARQYRRVLYQLGPAAEAALVPKLRTELRRPDGDLAALMQDFLGGVEDGNLARRYDFFYREIAPHLRLYPVTVGDVVTMRAFTRSGYMRSTNLKLYGLFQFAGMEDSDLSGVYNLMDLMTFRELYGSLTAEQRRELQAIKAEIELVDVGRADAEAALFGGGELVVEEDAGSVALIDEGALVQAAADARGTFDPAESQRGLALHAAVILDDAERLPEAQAAVQQALDDAGLELRAVDWRAAAGFVGQLATAMRMVLIFGIVVIFLVALVVVNNTVVISVIERINEIGTLRAIGAQRRFVRAMFLLETATIAALAGAAGALAGAGVVALLGRQGIPAFAENMNFVFGGPRLYPSLSADSMAVGFGIIVVVSLLAAFMPTRTATKVQPIEAMHVRD